MVDMSESIAGKRKSVWPCVLQLAPTDYSRAMARMMVPNGSETREKDIKNKRFTVGYLK